MSRKPRKKHGPRKAPAPRIGTQSTPPAYKPSRFQAIWSRLSGLSVRAKAILGSGAAITAYTVFLHFINGSISVAFSKPLPSGYEFVVSNDSPVEQTIEHLRIEPEHGTELMMEATETMQVTLDSQGRFPAGRIPASEFHDLDGQAIESQQRMSFRVPPLTDWAKMRTRASLVSITYRAVPTEPLLKYTADALENLGVVTLAGSQHYLVIDDYWTSTSQVGRKAAIRQACTEHVELRRFRMCDSND